MSKTLKGTFKNSKEIPVAGEEHGVEEHLEMKGEGGKEAGAGCKGFGSLMKQPIACCCDQVGLHIPFFILHLSDSQEVK